MAVAYWDWTASNGSASAAQTQAAYDAVTGNGPTEDFSYLVWNDMCNKVADCIYEMWGGDVPWIDDYATYAETLMTAADKEMTAARFNSLRFNVGSYYPTGISEKSPGDIIYGSLFKTLMTKVNEWIDTL
jgi:hypothetical protein